MRIPVPRRAVQSAEPIVIKEFAARDKDVLLTAGRLVVREANYGSTMEKLSRLTNLMIADAARFEPPLYLTLADVEVVEYAGERYAHTFGVETTVPEGHVIPDDYTRLQQLEFRY